MIPLILFVLGILGWTLTEYVMHRWVFHELSFQTQGKKEHLTHHRDVDYFTPTAWKVRTTCFVLPPLGAVGVFMLGPAAGISFTLGFGMGYLGYEWFHRRTHTHAPKTAYGRWCRKHHFTHHFHAPLKNHGVTCPWWDLVFGSYISVEQVVVPRRQAMNWLVNEAGDNVDVAFSEDYALKGVTLHKQAA